jgi:ABC-type multidrug transport system fused ATPase/permease subunit
MKNKPPITVNGTTALVQQFPWIQNDTIRGNILGGNKLDKIRYLETVRNCELANDLQSIKTGDLTEIGGRGINLSGGQKARVSLARAVYADKDIYLMDDPISALDACVRRKIIDNLIMGQLKNKTRILITHAIDFIHLADRIFIMKDGRIVEQGTYDSLKNTEILSDILKINEINNDIDVEAADSEEDDS